MDEEISEEVIFVARGAPSGLVRNVRPSNSRGMHMFRPASSSVRSLGPSHYPLSPQSYRGYNYPSPQLERFSYPRVRYVPGRSPANPYGFIGRDSLPGANIEFSQFDPHQIPDFSTIRVPPKSPVSYTTEAKDPRYLLNNEILSESLQSPPRQTPKRESLLQWFDRTVENELKKRRDASYVGATSKSMSPPSKLKDTNPTLLGATISGLDIAAELRSEQNNALLEAVDKLAKAQALCAFEGAVHAAEQAAANAPPELAEEAAAAGAREFQAELTSTIHEEIPGLKPVEVIGYVGVTRPRRPKMPK